MRLANPEIRFEVTNICNARCIMCPREKMTRPQGIMDLGLFMKVLDEAIALGATQVVLENYGESFCDPHIFERARYAKSKGMRVYTVTNASLLDEEACANIISYFDRIRISMYAATKQTYEKVHKGLNFEKVRGNVLRLLEARRRAKKDTPRIEMNYLLLEENAEEMDEFLRQYGKVADAVSVWKPHNWADGRGYRKLLEAKTSCGRPLSGPIQVQWDGLVVPCCYDFDSKIVLGDLNKQTLVEVIKGDAYARLRAAHMSGDYSAYPVCNVCDQLNKREDVLVYTTVKGLKVGTTSTNNFDLLKENK